MKQHRQRVLAELETAKVLLAIICCSCNVQEKLAYHRALLDRAFKKTPDQ
jgi:hypothetical protein